MRIVLLGAPGSGKGTQAARLACALGVTRMSSGDLFRDHQQRDTDLGRMVRSYVEAGTYVPDDVTIGMVMEWIDAPGQEQGFVLDGFPRTLAQACALEANLGSRGGIDKVLHISVSWDELTKRLAGRIVCRACQASYSQESPPPNASSRLCDRCGGELYHREDDYPEVVKRRIETYQEETVPVIQYYRDADKLTEINGEGPVDSVERMLIEALEGH